MFWLLAFSCTTSRSPEATPPPPSRPSLVLVTMDTTRRDRIGAYGYALAHTPNVDGFAAEGIRFDRAYATVPLTIPAHASMFTGVYPTKHGVHSNGDSVLPESFSTLAELLQASGYATAAAVSAFVTTRAWNFDQGFDVYLDDLSGKEKANRWRQERPANEVVDDAIAWLSAQPMDRPTFLWVHLYDPHRPYDPPAAWKEQLPERPYDGEIAFMDEQIGRLRATVDARGAPTAWMLLADHGEALGEHGEQDHGLFLFQPTVAIPFVIVPPKATEVHVSDTLASGVDVLPTAMAMLGLPPRADLDGVNLLTPQSRDAVHLEAFSAQQRFGYHPELAVVSGDLKLMDTPSPRLFDLRLDPREEQNLAAAQHADVGRLRTLSTAARADANAVANSTVAPETLTQLEALGYVGGGSIDTQNFSQIDAKDHVGAIAALREAAADMAQASPADAEAKLRNVLSLNPSMREARSMLAQALQRQRRFDEATALYRENVETDPTNTGARMMLAGCLAASGRIDEGVATIEAVLEQVPEDEQARVSLLRLLRTARRDESAESRVRTWLRTSPDSKALRAELGIVLMDLGRIDEAEPELVESMRGGDIPRLDVLAALGAVERARGNMDKALAHLEDEVARYPFNARARWLLAGLHMDNRRWDSAADEYRALANDMRDPNARRAWAQAVFNSGDYTLAREVLAPLDPETSEDPEVLLLQANILDKVGEKELAQLLFQRARAFRSARGAPGSPGR
jgi:arylsulfatase A-like enzyme/Tfp pilus assembly protein PilF